jgi:hypothetical protein
MSPPPGYDPRRAALEGVSERQGMADQRAVDLYRKKEEVLYDLKMKEDKAKAVARQQSTPRPVKSNAVGVLDARKLAEDGKVFEDDEGNAIDVANLPDSMGLISFVVKDQNTGAWKTVYQPFSPNQSTVTVGNESYAVSPMDKSKIGQGAGVDLGQQKVGSTTATTSPETGQTTVTKRTPAVIGATGRGAAGAVSGAMPPPPGGAAPRRAITGAGTGPRAAATGQGTPPLDQEGHIPDGVSTPQVVEGANRLLDGADPEKLKANIRGLSSKLARKYGWEQGRFTPKEQVALREATSFLDEAEKSSAFSVLDEGPMHRAMLSQILSDPEKMNMISRGVTAGLTGIESPQDAEYIRLYQQLVGTISGMGQLVRPGAKTTEAAVNNLRRELPNPLQSSSSADARARIARLKREIKIALEKGAFTEEKLAGPPGGTGKKTKSIDDEIMEAVGAAK